VQVRQILPCHASILSRQQRIPAFRRVSFSAGALKRIARRLVYVEKHRALQFRRGHRKNTAYDYSFDVVVTPSIIT